MLYGSSTTPWKTADPGAPVGGIEYVKNTNYVAIYWTGMEPGKDWIRLDSIRKFCGIPN